MRYFFGGAEAPTLRRRLVSGGANRFSVSFWHLRDRLPKSGEFPFHERFPDSTEILLDSGAFTANRRREEHDEDFFVDYLNAYVEIVAANIHRLTLVTEFDFLEYTTEDLWALRFDTWSELPLEKFLPVWHTEHGFEELVKLAKAYPRVAIPGGDIEEIAHRLPGMSNRYGCAFHGLSSSRQDLIERAGLASVSSTGWVAATRYGERVVFDGRALRRYTKDDKDDAIRTHASALERADFDVGALLDEDPDELTRLAVWSYDSWAEFLSRKSLVSDTSGAQNQTQDAQPEVPEPAPSGSSTLNSVVPRTPGSMQVLPILSVSQGTQRSMGPDGQSEVHSESQVASRSDSVRQCDGCYLAQVCPEFSPGQGCAYKIPVEIRSKDQLVAVMTAMLEIQGQRALFARFAEELEGGYPTKVTSIELDRFFTLTEKMKDIQDNRDFLRISVETSGQAGVLSRIFGSQAGEVNRALPAPVPSEEVMAEVYDAEVLD